jgi:hypothetical protein
LIGEREGRRLQFQDSLDAQKDARQRNRAGQFATPPALAVEIATYAWEIWQDRKDRVRFLDPALGTGTRSCAPWVRPVRYESWPQGVLFLPRRARRVFAPAFKAEVVRELITGKHSSAELCREHQLSPSLLALQGPYLNSCLN